MGGLRKSLSALVFLVAMPAPAAAADLCAALNRIVASSRETPPFASVRRALANGEAIVPGFDASGCEISSTTGINCDATSMSVGNFDDWPDLRACLGAGSEVARDVSPARLVRRDWSRTYVASGLRFQYGVHCIGCAGLAWSSFTVIFDGQGGPGD
jgi:hypothetical protein